MLMILDANGVKHKWDLETEKWVVYEESEKSKETSKEESQKSTKESSEEDFWDSFSEVSLDSS